MPLIDPYLKTTRAKEHLETLRQELQAFYESKPCRFVCEDDVENQLHVIRLEIADIPDKVTLVAGDVFYNLRASLDQLVWCLAKSAVPSYPKDTQFPILEQRDIKRFRRQTSGVPAEARAIIESLQPYNGGDSDAIRSHLLWRLNKLCNIDKHMRIPVHGTAGMIKWGAVSRDLLHKGFDDTQVMKIPLALKGKMGLNPKVTAFKVVFGDKYWGIECDIEGIETIYNFVADSVIPRFARFFK